MQERKSVFTQAVLGGDEEAGGSASKRKSGGKKSASSSSSSSSKPGGDAEDVGAIGRMLQRALSRCAASRATVAKTDDKENKKKQLAAAALSDELEAAHGEEDKEMEVCE